MRYISIVLLPLLLLTMTQAQEPASPDEFTQRGIARFQKNDLDGAIADFSKVIELNGKEKEFCYYFRGIAHYRKGNPTQAIEDMTKAIELKPDPRFLDDRGNLLARQGELDRAIADLSKAIELAPQFAKAYGDRGLVQLMRGDTTNAEIDFKKCFELDSSLEQQFKTAANQLKQRTVSRYLHEKPTDVEITKFSWAEAPTKELLGPSAAPITVTTSPVSPTGTRVLANPGVKGDPGPGEILNPSGITTTTSRPPEERTRNVIDYKFSISLKNNGSKTIVGVTWAYFFEPKNPSSENLSYLFSSKTSIAPEKEKTLNELLNSNHGSSKSGKLPSKHNQALYNERAAIIRLEYSDGTSWQRAADVATPTTGVQP
jgi:hypothetical protein